MKWGLLVLVFLAGFAVAHVSLDKEVVTRNIHLIKPAYGSNQWDEKLNHNFDVIDQEIAALKDSCK